MSSLTTDSLRDAALAAWRQSPTRFREDANAEEDLRLGGYRDRLLVELAQNAADAAGVAGTLRLSIADNELRAANTGAPLTQDGIAALASLRASAKHSGSTIGRFGVGFSAVLSVTDEPRLISTSGGVRFSAELTRQAVAGIPELAAVAASRAGQVPILRLVWPADGEAPPTGFATEVRLPLRAGVDHSTLLAQFCRDASDVLLALPALTRIEIGDQAWWREDLDAHTAVITGPAESVTWKFFRAHGVLDAAEITELGVEARNRPEWTVCWAIRVDESGRPVCEEHGVLHAPTPTDERLSLPARLFASAQLEPSRRRLLPGRATAAVLDAAVRAYPGLINVIEPRYRMALVPAPDFPLSETDDRLRNGVLDQLRTAEWLPLNDNGCAAPSEATVLEVVSVELVALLTDVLPGLAAAELSAPEYSSRLAALGVRRLGIAEVVDAVTGIARPPEWWRRLYSALEPIIQQNPNARNDFGALPVPLLDGRTVVGPRDVLMLDSAKDLSEQLSTMDILGLRVVHPDAVHPLLDRLGARHAGPSELLDAMRYAVEGSLADAESGLDITDLVDVILHLVAQSGTTSTERPWLAALALSDSHGGFRRADELILPSGQLLPLLASDVLGPEGPLGVLADQYLDHWPAEVLTAVGVLDSFATVVDEEPEGPDHQLADEQEWWAWRDGDEFPPASMSAIRDLDLIDDNSWPQALRLIAARPDTWRILAELDGYTGWWLARHAVLAGRAPHEWRLPSAADLAGLYDPVPDLGLAEEILVRAGVRASAVIDSPESAADVLSRLGDSGRDISAGVALRTYALVARAIDHDCIDVADVNIPSGVRTLAGTSLPVEQAVVLDVPWALEIVSAGRVVAAEPNCAEALAELLEVPLAADECAGSTVRGQGVTVSWHELGAVVLACDLIGIPLPAGTFFVHEDLVVNYNGIDHQVEWWITDEGILHVRDTAPGLARALAWITQRWPDRHVLAALLDEPTAQSYVA